MHCTLPATPHVDRSARLLHSLGGQKSCAGASAYRPERTARRVLARAELVPDMGARRAGTLSIQYFMPFTVAASIVEGSWTATSPTAGHHNCSGFVHDRCRYIYKRLCAVALGSLQFQEHQNCKIGCSCRGEVAASRIRHVDVSYVEKLFIIMF